MSGGRKRPADDGFVPDDGFVADDAPSFPDYSALPDEVGAPPIPAGTPIRTINPNMLEQAPAIAQLHDPIGAFARSGAQGITARFGDEISSNLAQNASDISDSDLMNYLARTAGLKSENQYEADAIPKTYAHGSQYNDMRDNMRADLHADKASYADAPWYADPSITGELAGGALLAVGTSGLGEGAAAGEAGQALSVANRLRQARNVGAAYGATSGLGGSEADDLGGMALDTAKGGATGAIVGPVAESVPMAAGAAANGMRSVAESLAPIADKYRFTASGVYPQQLTALLKEKGPDYIRELGQYAESLKGDGLLSFMKPWGARSYQEAAQLARDAASGRIGGNLATAEAEGVRVPTDPVADALESQAGDYGGALGTDPAAAQSNRLMSEASRWRTPSSEPMGNAGIDPYTLEPVEPAPIPPKTLTPSEAMGMKQEYEKLGGYAGDRIGTLPHGSTPEMYQDAANPVRGALYDAMDTSSVGPEFHGNMDEFGKANTILNASNKRVMHDDANNMISLPSAILASGGLESFGPAGLAAGGAMGAVKAVGKDVIGATGTRLLQYGAGGLSNAARAAEEVAAPLAISETQRSGTPELSRIGNAASKAIDATGFGASPAFGQAQMSIKHDGTDDPVEGQWLSSLQPDERATQYYVLMSSDPNFRARQRERGRQQTIQQENE